MSTVEQPLPGEWRPADDFGARLLLLRTQLKPKRTQAEAAAICGLDDGSWSNWENGTKPRDIPAVVRAVCKGMATIGVEVDRDWLTWGGPLRTGGFASDADLSLLPPLEGLYQGTFFADDLRVYEPTLALVTGDGASSSPATAELAAEHRYTAAPDSGPTGPLPGGHERRRRQRRTAR